MNERLYRLNMTYAIVDTLVCVLAVVGFAFAAWVFNKWWIVLFNIITLALFNSHLVVLENESGKGDSND